MIGSLTYLTASRPDIMFAVCAYARFQVTPKVSHLYAVKRIFRYLKGQSKLGLWYPRDSPFDLEAFYDSDYAGANLEGKSTTGGYQFLGKRLISWQCKKKIIVANSTTEAEYVAAPNCCGQVLWIQNQMLDYWFNFINTKIYIDNKSTICIVKNSVFHSKTKHIEIRHHFIRDSNKKKLIQMIKIHINQNVTDLLTKAFDVGRFQYLIANFLNGSHIRYALTKNPTIYVSLIEKFWQTATVRTVDNGEQEITATIDGKEFTVTEAFVRRHLQLADAEELIPNVVSSSHQKTQTSRQALNKDTELPQTSVPIPNVPDEAIYEEWDDIVERATTTVASLDAKQASGNITKTQSTAIPNVPLPKGIGACGSPRCQEATGGSIAQTRVLALETDLRQTKKVYGAAYTKLIMKVKKLEKTVKSNQARRRAKIVVLDDEEDSEDSSKKGRMIE
ncbi:hypothetical protein Tco_0791915 [Tanacetum coccineum]